MKFCRTIQTGLFLLAFFASPLSAASDAEAPAPKEPTAAELKEQSERREKIEEKKKDLNGSSWDVTLYPSGDAKSKPLADTLVFQDGQVRIKSLIDRGYTPTNYTITMGSKDSQSAVWETMQSSKDGLVFVRGEWNGDSMSGNVSEQLQDKTKGKEGEGSVKTNEYYFSNAPRKVIPPTSKKDGEGSAQSDMDTSVAKEPAKALVSKEDAKKDR